MRILGMSPPAQFLRYHSTAKRFAQRGTAYSAARFAAANGVFSFSLFGVNRVATFERGGHVCGEIYFAAVIGS